MCPLVSIIVPVYNVEKYLSTCINSILSQSVLDWELLLIDDGSNDRSGFICDDYSQIDPRIRVFHLTNGGVSNARNFGIDNARGKWLCFVDADDYLDSRSIDLCLKYEDCDLIRFSMEYVYSEENFNNRSYNLTSYTSKSDFLYDVISRNTILGVCAGFYKRDLFEQYKIRFNPKISLGEDWLVFAQLVYRANLFAVDTNCYYKYNKQNDTSCTHAMSLAKLSSLNMASTIICEMFSGNICNSRTAKAISSCRAKIGYQIFLSNVINDSDFICLKEQMKLSLKEILISDLKIQQKVLLILVLKGCRKIIFKLLRN